MLLCVHCRKSEECHYWSCQGSPVRWDTNTLDNLTKTAQISTLNFIGNKTHFPRAKRVLSTKLANKNSLFLSCPTFSVISCEWCSECSLSKNILCCSELARRQVNQVDKVQEEIPEQDRKKKNQLEIQLKNFFLFWNKNPILSILYFYSCAVVFSLKELLVCWIVGPNWNI